MGSSYFKYEQPLMKSGDLIRALEICGMILEIAKGLPEVSPITLLVILSMCIVVYCCSRK